MSSSDSERLSARSEEGGHATVTRESEEFSVLDSFDLPEKDLRDKVGYQLARPFVVLVVLAARSEVIFLNPNLFGASLCLGVGGCTPRFLGAVASPRCTVGTAHNSKSHPRSQYLPANDTPLSCRHPTPPGGRKLLVWPI